MKQSVMNIYIYIKQWAEASEGSGVKIGHGPNNWPWAARALASRTALGRRQDARALKRSTDAVKGASELSLTATDRPHANLKRHKRAAPAELSLTASDRPQLKGALARGTSKVLKLEEIPVGCNLWKKIPARLCGTNKANGV
jgi:hypothetical protein